MQEGQVYAFSISSPVTSHELANQCEVSLGREPEGLDTSGLLREPFIALWNTGATNCVISQIVVDACGLIPVGFTEVFHIDGCYWLRST